MTTQSDLMRIFFSKGEPDKIFLTRKLVNDALTFGATVSVRGKTLKLTDVGVYTQSRKSLTGLNRETLQMRTALKESARQAGVEELIITDSSRVYSSSSANVGKRINLRIDLTK